MVCRQLYNDQLEAHELDEKANFDDVVQSFYDGLAMKRRADEAAGIEPTVPARVSTGKVCEIKQALGIEDAAVGSTEIKRVDPVTNENHVAEFHRQRQQFSIPLLAAIFFDEFHDFRLRGPRRADISHTEKGSNAKRRVKHATTSR